MHPYASGAYADVFTDLAEPLWVPPWRTYVLVREVPGADAKDAVGTYPLTVFGEGADLAGGLEWLAGRDLISVGLVPDPATAPQRQALQAAFDLVTPFKSHLIVDYRREVRFSKHHRYEVKKALREVSVEVVDLRDHLEAWSGLYAALRDRHQIAGLAALPASAFARLAEVEGLVTVAAFADGKPVSMHLWMVQADRGVGYSLLAGSNHEGYRRSAAYAVYDASIRNFSDLSLLNLGGGAGRRQEHDGLTRFKRGFANAELQAHFCAAVLDQARYAALSGTPAATLPFPAYRFAPRRPHVTLRKIRPDDLRRLHGWYQTPALWDHLVGDHTPREEAEAVAYMQRWLTPSDTELRLAIEAEGVGDRRIVGLASLAPIDRKAGRAELHIMIGEAGDRGQGVGRQAVAALLEQAFGDLGLQRVELRVLESNLAARRLYERCGFTITGRAAPVMKQGRPVDVLVMEAQPRSATT